MNIKTNLIEEYVIFVDNTKKQNKNLWIFIIITFRNKINFSYICNNYV